MTAPLVGRRALVTGGASGIGRAIAEAMVGAGADVTILDRDEDGDVVAAEIGASSAYIDLSDPDFIEYLRRDLDCPFVLDDIDILVNNAGLQHVSPIEEFPPAKFDYILRVMLQAPFELIRATLPGMKARKWGRIINVSSVHGLRASAGKAAYVAAKHGLEGLSKVTALEGGPHGVTSNCINPAFVNTPLMRDQVAAQATLHGISEDRVLAEVMLERVAVKRLIEPSEVAELALMLCGPASASISGASFAIDGGWTAS